MLEYSDKSLEKGAPRLLRLKAFAWKIITLPFVGVIYWMVISEGVRLQFPIFATKLHQLPIPGISFLRHYHGFADFDLANLFSVILLAAVWCSWVHILSLILLGDRYEDKGEFNSTAARRIVTGLGIVLLVTDAVLFYTGISHQMMFGSGFVKDTFVNLIATAAYISMLIWICFVYVKLEYS